MEYKFGINGPFLTLLKSLYENVQIENDLSEWFGIQNRVKQGCILSPSLFFMFIKDLVHDINALGLGIMCGDCNVSTLLLTDDIVILAENEQGSSELLVTLSDWYNTCRWEIRVNPNKTKYMHLRTRRKSHSPVPFRMKAQKCITLGVIAQY